jgi:hypothetical protein
MSAVSEDQAIEHAVARIRELAESWTPPDFAAVPNPDAALLLCAIDHRTGYRGRYLVGGEGPYEGSALLWALGLREERRRPGTLTAAGLREVDERRVAEIFRIGGETAVGPAERARLWRGAAEVLERDYDGSTAALIAAGGGRLGWHGGILERLAELEAFSDPLRKKSFLFCKIVARRGWLSVADPEAWEVCADNVLMRLALRSGLVHQGEVDEVRAETAAAFGLVADRAGIPPPLLDDMLWELGREDPDLLGAEAGDLSEPARPQGSHFW